MQRAEDSEIITKSVHGLPPTVIPVMSVKPLSAMVMTVPGVPDEGETEVITVPLRYLMSWLSVSATYRKCVEGLKAIPCGLLKLGANKGENSPLKVIPPGGPQRSLLLLLQ